MCVGHPEIGVKIKPVPACDPCPSWKGADPGDEAGSERSGEKTHHVSVFLTHTDVHWVETLCGANFFRR